MSLWMGNGSDPRVIDQMVDRALDGPLLVVLLFIHNRNLRGRSGGGSSSSSSITTSPERKRGERTPRRLPRVPVTTSRGLVTHPLKEESSRTRVQNKGRSRRVVYVFFPTELGTDSEVTFLREKTLILKCSASSRTTHTP